MRVSDPGKVRAWCRAIIPAIVDLPDWREQLRSTRVELDRRRRSCQGSSSASPTEVANSTRSAGMSERSDTLRSRRRRTSDLSDAVLTLQFLYLGCELV